MHFEIYVSVPGLVSAGLGLLFGLIGSATGHAEKQLKSATAVEGSKDLAALKKRGQPVLVAVRGAVGSERPLLLQLDNNRTLRAAMTNLKEDEVLTRRNADGNWYRDTASVIDRTEETTWFIEGKGFRVPVMNPRQCAGTLPWVKVQESWEPSQKSVLAHATDYITGVKVLGTRTVDSAIPLGSVLTVVAELAGEPEGLDPTLRGRDFFGVVLRRPQDGCFYITSRTLPELIAMYGGVSRACRWAGVGLGGLGAILVTHKLVKGFVTSRRFREWRRRAVQAITGRGEGAGPGPRLGLAEGLLAGRGEAGAAGGGEGSEGGAAPAAPAAPVEAMCAVCYERKPDMVWIECGHMCTCQTCAARMDKCPLCRRRSRVIKVFQG